MKVNMPHFIQSALENLDYVGAFLGLLFQWLGRYAGMALEPLSACMHLESTNRRWKDNPLQD